MSAPINTQNKNRHFLKPSAPVAPCLSAAFLAQTDEIACFSARFRRRPAGKRSVCVGNAAERRDATGADGFRKCRFRC